MSKLKDLDIDEIALVRKGHQPVNPDATISVVKSEPVSIDEGRMLRIMKALLPFMSATPPTIPAHDAVELGGDGTAVQVAEEQTLPVLKAKKAKDFGGSYEARRSAVASKIADAHGYSYIEETHPDHVIASSYTGSGEKLHSIPYTIDADGNVELGERTEMQRNSGYSPVEKAEAVLKAAEADLEAVRSAAQIATDTTATADAPAPEGETTTEGEGTEETPGTPAETATPAQETVEAPATGEGTTEESTETPAQESTEPEAVATEPTEDEMEDILKALREEFGTFRTELTAEISKSVDEKIAAAVAPVAEQITTVTKAMEDGGIAAARATQTPATPEVSTPVVKAQPSIAGQPFGAALRTLLHGE